MDKINKKIGLGSLSLLLCIIGISFPFSFGSKGAYGDNILQFVGLKPWSNGDTGIHYTVFYSLIFFVMALVFSYKFKNDFGAKVGKIISLCVIIIVVIGSVTNIGF